MGSLQQKPSSPLLVGGVDAAKLLGISPRHLWALTKKKAVPSRKLGHRTLYSPIELQEWIAKGCPGLSA